MIRRAFLSLVWLLVAPAAYAQIGDLSGASAKPDFATNSLTLGELAGDFVRATFFGAKFDAVSNVGGVVAAGSTDFHNSAVTFTAADIGKAIILYGAGANGDPLRTTITAVSGTHATLATTATSAMISTAATAVTVSAPGTGFQPFDIVPLSGGTATAQAQVFIASTQVATATVASGGSGGTTGACTLTGTTGNVNGTSTVFQATGTVTAGAVGGALTVTVAGTYRDNPANIAAEPVTGCGLTGATVTLTMGAKDVLLLHPGVYSSAPSSPASQGTAIMGAGTGATFTLTTGNAQTWIYGTDSGPGIQAAIDYCETKVVTFAQGCTVWVPPGQTIIGNALTINKQMVSLSSFSHSSGFWQRNVAGPTQQSFPTRLIYGGPTNPGYLMTQVPLLADAKRLVGNDLTGIMFDCDGEFGCGGVLLQSTMFSTYRAAVSEPQPRAYTVNGAVTAGANTITLTSVTGITLGQAFLSPNFLSGTYIQGISGNVLTLSSQAYGGGVADARRVLVGGEGWRMDVLPGLATNDIQNNDLWISSRNLNTVSPCMLIGGYSPAGSPEYGNTSINQFWQTACYFSLGDALVINNSDHNLFFMQQFVPVPSALGIGAGIVSNGSLDANNGGARYNWFRQGGGQRGNIFRGTTYGGFTEASLYNKMEWHILSGGGFVTVDTAGGATLCMSDDTHPAIGCLGNTGISAQVADSGLQAGNARGQYSVSLQTAPRTTATHDATAHYSTITGGSDNTASGLYSVVNGGSINTSTAQGASSGGLQAASDLEWGECRASGVISSGRHGQSCVQVLRGISAANTSPVRLTSGGSIAGSNSNCVNLAAGGYAANLHVQLTAVDPTTTTNVYAWTQPQGLLLRSGNQSTTVYVPGTPTELTNGTTTGIAITESADTTNGCYSITFTPPTSNTHLWHIAATVRLTRVE